MRKSIWTPELEEAVARMWNEGKTAGDIHHALGIYALGISRNAILGKIHRLGLIGRPSPLYGGLSKEQYKLNGMKSGMARRGQRRLSYFVNAADQESPQIEIYQEYKCKKCGGTERYRADRHCVKCRRGKTPYIPTALPQATPRVPAHAPNGLPGISLNRLMAGK